MLQRELHNPPRALRMLESTLPGIAGRGDGRPPRVRDYGPPPPSPHAAARASRAALCLRKLRLAAGQSSVRVSCSQQRFVQFMVNQHIDTAAQAANNQLGLRKPTRGWEALATAGGPAHGRIRLCPGVTSQPSISQGSSMGIGGCCAQRSNPSSSSTFVSSRMAAARAR